jgi:ABC-type transport system substrate-binding protein
MDHEAYQNRWSRRALPRRRMLAGTALGGVGLVAIAAGCSSTNKQGSTPAGQSAGKPAGTVSGTSSANAANAGSPAAKQPKRGGTLTSSQDIAQNTIDPHIDSPVVSGYWRFMYEGLLAYDFLTGAIQPELAQKWEQPSQTEYVLTLQPGVKWQNKGGTNGRAFTIDDALYSLQRLQTNNPRFTSAGLLSGVKAEAVDPQHLKLSTAAPDAVFLNKIAGDSMLMLAKEVVDKVQVGFSQPEQAVGTGPFILNSFQPTVGTDSNRNPDYWQAGIPYVDKLRTSSLNSGYGNERSWAAFQAGRVDTTTVPGNQSKSYLSQQGKDFQPLWAKDITPYLLVPNSQQKPFDDPRLAKALGLLVDRDEAVNAWAEQWSGRGRYGSFLPPNLDQWDLPQDEYKKQPGWQQPKDAAVKEALNLLQAAGYSKDKPLSFQLTFNGDGGGMEAMGVLIQAQFRRLGQGAVTTEVRKVEGTVYQTVRANRDFAVMISSSAATYYDPDAWLFQSYRTKAPRNYWSYSDPQVDSMMDKERTLFDLAQRKAQVQEILRYMLANWPGSGIVSSDVIAAAGPKVRGFTPEIWFNGRNYKGVWFDT